MSIRHGSLQKMTNLRCRREVNAECDNCFLSMFNGYSTLS